jgi:hypothetical protein
MLVVHVNMLFQEIISDPPGRGKAEDRPHQWGHLKVGCNKCCTVVINGVPQTETTNGDLQGDLLPLCLSKVMAEESLDGIFELPIELMQKRSELTEGTSAHQINCTREGPTKPKERVDDLSVL